MAKEVIDGLEIVDIEKHHHKRILLGVDEFDVFLDVFDEYIAGA